MNDLVDKIADGLMTLGPRARAAVEAATREAASNSKAAEILTFVTPGGRQIAPEASTTYVSALWSFTTGKPYEGHELDSSVTPRVIAAAEAALSDLLASPDACAAMMSRIAGNEDVRGAPSDLLNDELRWIAREAFDASGVSPKSILASQVADAASDQAVAMLNSAAGQAVLAAIAKAIATTTGKVLIVKLIQLSIAKFAASAALKTLVAALIKKIGVAVIAKGILIKILAVALPGLIAVKIPIFWVLIPLVGAFIYYEMKHLPAKLADQLPPQVGAKVAEAWPEISRQVAVSVLAEATRRAAAAAH